MTTHNVNLKGKPDPDPINVNPGDIVFFSVGSENIVLCLPPEVFGAERIEIPAGNTAAVGVKSDAPSGDFVYWRCDAKTIKKRTCGEVKSSEVINGKGKWGDSGKGKVGG